MRKSIAISLLLIYIIASSGVAINVHYSSGKIKSINLVLDSKSDKADIKTKVTSNPICSHKCAPATTPNNSFKDVLNCVSIVSQGFIQTYDDADTMSVCASCSTDLTKGKCPTHFVSID